MVCSLLFCASIWIFHWCEVDSWPCVKMCVLMLCFWFVWFACFKLTSGWHITTYKGNVLHVSMSMSVCVCITFGISSNCSWRENGSIQSKHRFQWIFYSFRCNLFVWQHFIAGFVCLIVVCLLLLLHLLLIFLFASTK